MNASSNAISYGYKRQYGDMTSRVLNAVNNNNLKMMLYNGDVDLACNALMGQRFTDKLGLTVSNSSYDLSRIPAFS